MPKSITIQKDLPLPESSNYQLLRQKGLEYIQSLGSKLWTDYNIHDPGITLLEALCYALTDLGYRTSLDIKDLLALPSPETADAEGQYPADKRQAFYTARNILTINPWTTHDFRKLLINIDGIKNGWMHCKACPCETFLFADCTRSVLRYEPTEHTVIIKGLYDVLLEFEEEEKSGNLNSGKIRYNFSFENGLQFANAIIEMRLPSWAKLEEDLEKYKLFRGPDSEISDIAVPFISGNKNDNSDIPLSPESLLDNALRKPVFATIEVTFRPDKNDPATDLLIFEDIPLTVWFRNSAERRALTIADLKQAIMDKTLSGILPKYLEKIKRADSIIQKTTTELHNHRNLAEDYCTVKAVEVEDIGVCADMQVEASADIEAILAEAYYLIDQYMSPDIKFYSLRQLLDASIPVDEIFEGPALSNGFINDAELAAASLRTVLYTSDIINLLMDLPGVISINNFVFTRYDDNGFLVESQAWSMPITYNRQPRLYLEASKVLIFKNGLPYLPDSNELSDTLQVIKGKNSQPKFSLTENDLPVPHGNHYNLETYFAVQDSLPLTYGTGYDGLPASANEPRKAQAKQLKAYLLFFEQMLVNYLAQLSHAGELFAVDETVVQTYFSRFIQTNEISGLADLYDGMNSAVLQGLIEKDDIFLDRRNRFLDHLLARFAETFNDYALMLYSYTDDKAIADQQLIRNKISFISNFPELSSKRARAFNYKYPSQVCTSLNISTLVRRIQLLLGYDTTAEVTDLAEQIFIVEHLLLRPRNVPGSEFPEGDPLLTVCLPGDCSMCGEEDPYSFRVTVVLNGEDGLAGRGMEFRRFAEQTIRMEIPAHLGVKICWVSKEQLAQFEGVYCAWLTELAKAEPDPHLLHDNLVSLLAVFQQLKNVYPQATLHDCIDGNDGNRVFLGRTAIISNDELDEQIKKKNQP